MIKGLVRCRLIWSISISIPRGLKSFMLKNWKVDFLGNSEVAFFYTPGFFIYILLLPMLGFEK